MVRQTGSRVTQLLINLGVALSLTISLIHPAFPTPSLTQKPPLQPSAQKNDVSSHFLSLLLTTAPSAHFYSLNQIEENWQPELTSMALETISFSRNEAVRIALAELVSRQIGELENKDNEPRLDSWYHWLWNSELDAPLGYANFKANLYRNIDIKFDQYFRDRQIKSKIRLDEIQWGGVVQDGIPPLRQPHMLAAKEASYLGDDNIVFGIKLNGDARAYPKRILAWHEMFIDTIGGVEIAGVYCTLCGAVIPYRTEVNGKRYELGTSGFLYRSNKLMYDKATQSLWSTHEGTPVLGPLVGKNIQLEFEAVVTTTWGEWRKRHPQTKVLALDTGHQRDYGEGAAYANYFNTDRLMFRTPFLDNRLKNKQEVLALRFPASPKDQLAIDTGFLINNPLYTTHVGAQKVLVLTDKTGANRVYDPEKINFGTYGGGNTLSDKNGEKWQVLESHLENSSGKQLARLPAHRAFWFGWRAAFPQTKLIK